jgi:nucleotide-binding universal stress UspA family protein
VREAIEFAKKCASRLYVMSVLETNPEYETIGASVYQKEEEEATKYLEAVKSKASQEGVSYCETALHYDEEPCQRIVDEALERNVDMIIIGRRGRRGLMKVLMGPVASKVVSHAPCKVLVVPRAARVECRNILIATDGSEHSIAAAAEAVKIAKRCGSNMLAVSSVHSETDLEGAKAHVHDVVEMAQRDGIAVEALTPLGRSHDVIVETAGGRGVDLIVMGTYGKGGLKKRIMGSSTEKVIGHASCAVLVVRAGTPVGEQCAPGGAND